MANTYTQILYHVVFSTKHRSAAIGRDRRDDLYRYIWGIHENLGCHLYRIGGMPDHLHILTSLPPAMALAKYVEQLKTGSTRWIRTENVFPDWPGWQDGYGAFTLALSEKDAVIDYIKNQEIHHAQTSFLDEYRALLESAGIAYDERYLAS